MIKKLIDAIQGKAPLSSKRSPHWPTVRKHFLQLHPTCAVCGGVSKLEVHHKQPFHINPSLELDMNNLITLCESGKNGVTCHLFFGHLGNYKSVNPNVEQDSLVWSTKLRGV
jgi:5-methylcytosine-specific restriction enzyme A